MADLRNPVLADLVESEFGRAIERLETLLDLADRMELPPEVVEQLDRTKTEAETGLERLARRSV